MAADMAADRRFHRRCDARSDLSTDAQGKQGWSGARQAATQRASIHGRALDRRWPRDELCSTRLRNRVLERSADQFEIAGVKAVHERTKIRPLLHGVPEWHGATQHGSRLGGLYFQIRVHDNGCETSRYRQFDDIG